MKVNKKQVADAIKALIVGLGYDPASPGLADTPKRVAKFFEEWQKSERYSPAFFEEHHKDLIILKNIPFFSLCEHHLLPFFGKVHVGYIPNGEQVIGVSKLVRIVHKASVGLQVQERICNRILEEMKRTVSAVGIIVIVEATHLCMAMRGVHTPLETTMVTSAICGVFEQPGVRQEFLSLLK